MNQLKGKVAVVLGASAEAGTGWAIAEALAEAGAKVVVGARSLAPLRQLAQKIAGTALACCFAGYQMCTMSSHFLPDTVPVCSRDASTQW